MSLFMIGFRFAPLALIGLTAVGCTEVPSEDDLEFRTTCISCTLNSPHIDNAPIPELAFDGEENSAGVSVVGLRLLGVYPRTFEFDVIDDEIVARDGESIIESGSGLIGWELVMERDGEELIAKIAGYDDAVVGLTDKGLPLTAYAIAYEGEIGEGNAHKNVCPEFLDSPSEPVLTVIRSQTYDREAKVVDLTDPNWVTFACQGEAAYKAKALGYSESRIFPGTTAPATLAQQNATLKMITADYCGTGHSFTAQNTPIQWENRAGTVTPQSTLGPLEAVWGPGGALCLNTPRRRPRAEVEALCTIPSCDNFDFNGAWEWKTWRVLPPPPPQP